jgi:ParB family transcriptional regulator, chromosome partitioning protein
MFHVERIPLGGQIRERKGFIVNELKTKSRLGRGLGSLISMPPEGNEPAIAVEIPVASDMPASSVGRIIDIPIESIVPNPHQPRRVMSESGVAELAASLKSTGLIQPIVVRKISTGYELIAGERRWRAARTAGFHSIPGIVKDADSFAQAQMALVENIQRENLNPIDRASAYKSLIEKLGLTQAELAQRLGEDRSGIANHLRLLDLVDPVQALIRDGKLQLGHGKVLAGISQKLDQERLALMAASQDMSVRRLEELVANRAQTSAASAANSSAYLTDLERNISRQLGLKVNIRTARNKKGKGRLIIHYNTLDEFDRITGMLGVKAET